ncbi:MAG: FtsW/RodA/SpoVE family cell cycle protein [bacterium]
MKLFLRLLIVSIIALVLFGCVLVFSASTVKSATEGNVPYLYFKSHLWKVIIAFLLMIIFSTVIKPEDLYKYDKHILFITIALLILTLFVGIKVNGARRWIDLGFIPFQPSELAKLVIIIHLAKVIDIKKERIREFKTGFMFALVLIVVFAILIIAQPNVSTGALLVLLAFSVLFAGGAKLKHIFGTLGTGVIAVGGVAMIMPHSRERIMSFVHSLISGTDMTKQVLQAKIALGSGGLWGLGFGESKQSNLFVPEPYTDFIFSILGEERGFIGTFVVLFLYVVIFAVGLIVANKSDSTFKQLMVFGLSFNIILTAFINASVVTGLVPTTGITLPFISFGGTSILMYCISIGIIINVGMERVRFKTASMAQA